jgi:hypothetical protein
MTSPGRAIATVPIAYQHEFFNQLTSEDVRTRVMGGHPVRCCSSHQVDETRRSTAAFTRCARCTPLFAA